MTDQTPTVHTLADAAPAPVVALSVLIDSTYPADLDTEAHRWRRCAKVAEEVGEVTEALLGLAGENPRKGITHDLGQLRKELLDVALAALGAIAHLDGNTGDPMNDLARHTDATLDRLRAVVDGPTLQGDDQ